MTPCPFGECVPVDACAACPEAILTDGRTFAVHRAGDYDHAADPIVVCERCGTEAETVDPDELAAAWPMPPLPGQVSWLAD